MYQYGDGNEMTLLMFIYDYFNDYFIYVKEI